MSVPDILYAVRPGERNEALRFSLRSLANLEHNRVFIAGHCPTWVRNVTPVPVRRRVNKLDAIEENVRAGLQHPEMGEDVIYMNDDFYIMEMIDRVPITHGGPVSQYLPGQELKIRMRQTIRHLGPGDLLTYDGIHMPLPIKRDLALAAFAHMPRGVLWRTWYGNSAAIGGTVAHDTKSRNGEIPPPGLFLSTKPKTLHTLKRHLDEVLPRGNLYA